MRQSSPRRKQSQPNVTELSLMLSYSGVFQAGDHLSNELKKRRNRIEYKTTINGFSCTQNLLQRTFQEDFNDSYRRAGGPIAEINPTLPNLIFVNGNYSLYYPALQTGAKSFALGLDKIDSRNSNPQELAQKFEGIVDGLKTSIATQITSMAKDPSPAIQDSIDTIEFPGNENIGQGDAAKRLEIALSNLENHERKFIAEKKSPSKL